MGIFEGPTEKIWKVARDPTLGIPEQHKECKFYSKSSDTPSRGAKQRPDTEEFIMNDLSVIFQNTLIISGNNHGN